MDSQLTPTYLRVWRMGRQMTQIQAAKAVGASRYQWQRWESGAARIPPGLAERLRAADGQTDNS